MASNGTELRRLLEWRDRAVQGDDAALEALIKALHEPVQRFLAGRLTGSYAAAFVQDAMQETFIRVCNSLQTCTADNLGQLVRWVLTVARNCAMDTLRTNEIWSALRNDPFIMERAREADIRNDVDAFLQKRLMSAYGELPAGTQQLLWEHLVCGASWAEVALSLGTTPTAAKRRFQRAQARLRRTLDR